MLFPFFLGSGTSAMVQPSNQREMLHCGMSMCRMCLLHFWWPYPQGPPNIRPKRGMGSEFGPVRKPFDREFLENGSHRVTCQLGLNISSKDLSNMYDWAVAPRKVKVKVWTLVVAPLT